MKKKSSFLWLYLIGLLLAGQILYICFYAGRWKTVLVQAEVLRYTLKHWVLFFAIMLIAAFVKGRENDKRCVLQLLCALFVEILILILAVFLPVALVSQFYFEYLLICIGRISYYFGLPGIVAILIGVGCAQITRNHAGYVLVLGIAMITCEALQGYEIYNINYYDPCPVGEFFTLRQPQAYNISEMLKGLVGKSCTYEETKNIETFRVSEYNLELWMNQEDLFHGVAEVLITDEKEQYSFRLNSFMMVTGVTDESGESLSWNHKNNVLTIHYGEGEEGSNRKLIISFACEDETVLGIRNKYISLPDYIMYYPQPVDKETMYQVRVHSDGKVYCNLSEQSCGTFCGEASSVSILGGSMIGEMYYKDCRIIYPMLGFLEEDIIKRYEYNLATVSEEFQGKNAWFIDSFASLSYENYYDDTEMQNYDYAFFY